MKLFITGINGFAGRHLARLASELGWEILGSVRPGKTGPLELGPGLNIPVVGWDIASEPFPSKALEQFRPDGIVHMAAESFAGSAGLGSDSIWQANLFGTRRLYEAVAKSAPQARVLYVGTGLTYGPPTTQSPKSKETDPLCPPNNYAATKSCADLVSYQAFCDPGLQIIRARPFNHIGPGQSARFAVPSFARQFAAMKKGLIPHRLEVGNLDSARDFTDVRDIVRGYAELLLRGRPGEAYNLGTGEPTGLRLAVDFFSQATGIQPELVLRKDFLRKSDPPILLADRSKVENEIGWKPQISMKQTLQDILDDWLSRPEKEILAR